MTDVILILIHVSHRKLPKCDIIVSYCTYVGQHNADRFLVMINYLFSLDQSIGKSFHSMGKCFTPHKVIHIKKKWKDTYIYLL